MIKNKRDYLDQLEIGLGNHPEKARIIEEYDQHISELMIELNHELDKNIMDEVVRRLGSPKEIIAAWKDELSITPKKTQLIFIVVNFCLFLGGSILTFTYNYLEWEFVQVLWTKLTSIPNVIILLYLGFWALLGYEIGKGFGHGGKRLLKKTFFLSLIPNITLMYLTVFQLIPFHWFSPLLNTSFILKCIIFTLFLYSICMVGFLWGKKASI